MGTVPLRVATPKTGSPAGVRFSATRRYYLLKRVVHLNAEEGGYVEQT
jgi:hypothetical protein